MREDISVSYSFNDSLYYIHCKQLNILPIKFRFVFHNLKFLHCVLYNFSCVKLLSYINFYCGTTRLRSCYLEYLSLVNSKSPNGKTAPSSRNGFSLSFFHRSHLMWNLLPLYLRQIKRPSVFKIKFIDYIWNESVNINIILIRLSLIMKFRTVKISLSHLMLSQIFFLE